MMAVFWTSLSGVKTDLPCVLLHAEVTSHVSNLFSGWHYLTALQMSEFIHSSNCQSHLTILSELILIRNLLIVSVMTIDNFFCLTGSLHLLMGEACVSAIASVWRSEDNLWEMVLFFHPVGPRGQTYSIRFGCRCQ